MLKDRIRSETAVSIRLTKLCKLAASMNKPWVVATPVCPGGMTTALCLPEWCGIIGDSVLTAKYATPVDGYDSVFVQQVLFRVGRLTM